MKKFLDMVQGKYIEIYIVLIAIFVVFVADVLGVDTLGPLSEITLATLGILLYEILETKRETNIQKNALKKIYTTLNEVRDKTRYLEIDLIFKDRTNYTTPIELRIKNAKEVCISGRSLIGFVTLYTALFKRKAEEGCKFLVVLNDPAIDIAETQNAKQTLRRLEEIYTAFPTQIEVRFSPKVLHNSILAFDKEGIGGEIQVEFYSFSDCVSDRPHVTLSDINNKWYKFYKNEFDVLWKKSRSYMFNNEVELIGQTNNNDPDFNYSEPTEQTS